MELIEAASAEFERAVRLLPESSWGRPTPSEVSVRELVEHVVVGNRFTAAAGRRGSRRRPRGTRR
ncbi:MAG: maleylpyruvate isomerase N-terminal domain-containing protein [Actinomycetota bacterium]|nr:maleylpyruvate isomerase N-terminal domain-containing protein [Actinomycetota bacterium]